MRLFGLFSRGRDGARTEAPSIESKKTSMGSPEDGRSQEERNKEIMVRAIAENMLNMGMTFGKGSVKEREESARQMAKDALAMVADKYKTLPTGELEVNKSLLVGEAMRLYKESQEQERVDKQAGLMASK